MREVKTGGPVSPSSADPFAAMPPILGEPLLRLWAMNQDLYPGKMPLAALVLAFRGEEDVTDRELAEILHSMGRPEAIKGFRFAADLKCHLAAEVAEIRRRKREARNLQRIRATGRAPQAEADCFTSIAEQAKRRAQQRAG